MLILRERERDRERERRVGGGVPVGGELVTRVRKINGDEHFSSASFPVLMFCTETSRTTHTHALSVQLNEHTLKLELITAQNSTHSETLMQMNKVMNSCGDMFYLDTSRQKWSMKRSMFLLTSVSNQQLIFLSLVNCLYTQSTAVYEQFFTNLAIKRAFSFKKWNYSSSLWSKCLAQGPNGDS